MDKKNMKLKMFVEKYRLAIIIFLIILMVAASFQGGMVYGNTKLLTALAENCNCTCMFV